jgi:histidinol phosphatase-like enzyme
MEGGRKAVFMTHWETIAPHFGADYLPGVETACRRLKDAGFMLVVVEREAGVLERDLATYRRKLKTDLGIGQVLICNHRDDERCICAPPSQYLINTCLLAHRINPLESNFIGSSYEDVSMGRAAGIGEVYFVVPNTTGFADVTERILK